MRTFPLSIILAACFAAWKLMILKAEWDAGMPYRPNREERSMLSRTLFSLEMPAGDFDIASAPYNHHSVIVLNGVGNIADSVVTKTPTEYEDWYFEEYLQSDVTANGDVAALRKRHLRLPAGYNERFEVLIIRSDMEKKIFVCELKTCAIGPVRWSPNGTQLAFLYRVDHDLFLGIGTSQNDIQKIPLGEVGGWVLDNYRLEWTADERVLALRSGNDTSEDIMLEIDLTNGTYEVMCEAESGQNDWKTLQDRCKKVNLQRTFGDIESGYAPPSISTDDKYAFRRESHEALIYTQWIEGENLETGEKFLVRKLPVIFPYLP